MSSLTQFRDHCRAMAEAEHKPECPSLRQSAWVEAPADWTGITWMGLIRRKPEPCDGCNPQADRDLFARLAGEVDDYLAPQVDPFGEMTDEPAAQVASAEEREAAGAAEVEVGHG